MASPPFYPVSRFSSNSPSRSKFGQSEKRYGVRLDLFDAADNIVCGQTNHNFLTESGRYGRSICAIFSKVVLFFYASIEPMLNIFVDERLAKIYLAKHYSGIMLFISEKYLPFCG